MQILNLIALKIYKIFQGIRQGVEGKCEGTKSIVLLEQKRVQK